MPFLSTQPGPLGSQPFSDPMAQFRCDNPREVLALLRSLCDKAGPVALSGPCGATLTATVWTLDAERGRMALDVEHRSAQLQSLVDGNEATAVAYLDAVKLQFDLQDLVLVRSPKACALQVRLPRCVYRFQRRNAYRVRTLERPTPCALLRHPGLPEMALSLRILDLSIGGCALLLPDDVPMLPLGITLGGVQLVLDTATVLNVTLRLQHASSITGAAPGLRLGCEIVSPAAHTQRLLQRHIDQTQKRRRLLAQDG